jgi:creatinine amidohydrolase
VRSGYWQDLTAADFATLDPERTLALLPVAAVEQHGAHLPLAADALINEALVAGALERLAENPVVLALPPLPIGASEEHARFPGTLSIRPATLADAWCDVGRGVARAGVRKLVVLNTHGGQRSVVDQVALTLRAELGMLVVRASYFAFGAPEGLFDADELAHGLHGGDAETSLLLHLRPDLVRREALGDFPGLAQALRRRNRWLGVEKPVGIGWLAGDLHPAGVSGNAARADGERGARYFAHLVDCLAALLREVADTPLAVLR